MSVASSLLVTHIGVAYMLIRFVFHVGTVGLMDENVGIDPNERDESESSNVDKESDAAKYLERRKEREADLTEEEISVSLMLVMYFL